MYHGGLLTGLRTLRRANCKLAEGEAKQAGGTTNKEQPVSSSDSSEASGNQQIMHAYVGAGAYNTKQTKHLAPLFLIWWWCGFVMVATAKKRKMTSPILIMIVIIFKYTVGFNKLNDYSGCSLF